jgi:hypothetical protein
MYQWITYDRANMRIQIFNDQRFPVSSRLFNGWDWDNNNKELKLDYPKAVFQDILFEINREKLNKLIL